MQGTVHALYFAVKAIVFVSYTANCLCPPLPVYNKPCACNNLFPFDILLNDGRRDETVARNECC